MQAHSCYCRDLCHKSKEKSEKIQKSLQPYVYAARLDDITGTTADVDCSEGLMAVGSSLSHLL